MQSFFPKMNNVSAVLVAAFFWTGLSSSSWAQGGAQGPLAGNPADAAQADQLYQTAVTLYHNKEYSEALLKFFKLQELKPAYKDSESYISKIENYLSFMEKQRQNEVAVLRRQDLKEDRLRRIEERLREAQNKSMLGGQESRTEGSPDVPVPIAGTEAAVKEKAAVPEGAISSVNERERNLRNEVALKKSEDMKQKEEQLARKRKRLAQQAAARERRETAAQIQRTYREAMADYKAGLFSMSRDELENLKSLLERQSVSANLRKEMSPRVQQLDRMLEGKTEDVKAQDRYLLLEAESNNSVKAVTAPPDQGMASKEISDKSAAAAAENAAAAQPASSQRIQTKAEKQTQKDKARLDKLEAREEARQNKLAAKQKTREDRLALKKEKQAKKSAQKSQSREERLAARDQARREKIEAQQKAREDRLAKKEEKRAEKIAAAQARRKEAKANLAKAEEKEMEGDLRKFHRKMFDMRAEEAQGNEVKYTSEVRQHRAALNNEKARQQKDLERGVAGIYNDAIVFYAQGAYDRAAQLMQEVDKLWPDYKLCRSYLQMIRQEQTHAEDSIGADGQGRLSLEKEDVVTATLDAFQKQRDPTHP